MGQRKYCRIRRRSKFGNYFRRKCRRCYRHLPHDVTIGKGYSCLKGLFKKIIIKTFCFCIGLFHRVISQSGVNLNPWAQPAHTGVAEKRAAMVGEKVGCKKQGSDWAAMINCLRKVDAAAITETFYDFFVSIIFYAFWCWPMMINFGSKTGLNYTALI